MATFDPPIQVAPLDKDGRLVENWRAYLRNLGAAVTALVGESSPLTFAALPTPATEGMLRRVTDSNTNVWGATIAGGGANNVLAFFDGSNWTVSAK